VSKIAYSSPGSVDLTGVGKAVEATTKFIQFLIEHFSSGAMRAQELLGKKIENARAFTAGIKEAGSVEEFAAVMDLVEGRTQTLTKMIESRKISEVRMLKRGE